MKINFLDPVSIDALKSHINTTDICAYELAQIDWPDAANDNRALSPDETNNLLHAAAYLLNKQRRKELAAVKPLNNPFKLASLFMGVKDVRYYLNAIYATGTHLVASNGHVLIKVLHECEPGYYDAHGVKTDIDARYPDFNKTLNDDAPRQTVTLKDVESLMATGKIKVDRFTVNEKEHYYEHKYLQIPKNIGVKEARINDKGTLYFNGDTFTGVIMPTRI